MRESFVSRPIRLYRSLALIAVVSVVVAGGFCSRSSAQTEFVGPGIAGQIHAATFDPNDPNTIYLGGDTSGVFRSTDGGQSWEIWSSGLGNSDMALSFYVDDLLVVDGSNGTTVHNTGVYAATHGGIYRRETDGSSWSLETDYTINSEFRYVGGWLGDTISGAVPFSSVAYDSVNGVLYAGAGHSRFDTPANSRIYYPEAGDAPRYALWRKNLRVEGSTWEHVPGSGIDPRMVTDLAVVEYTTPSGSPGTFIVYSSREGITRYNPVTDAVDEISINADKSLPQGLSWSGRFWSVAAGYGGRVYAVLQGPLFDPTLNAAVVYRDLPLGDADGWHFLDSPADSVFPDSRIWSEILSAKSVDLATLTVVPGITNNADDIVYVGETTATGLSGYYRYGHYYSEPDSLKLGWIHMHRFVVPLWNSFVHGAVDFTANPAVENILSGDDIGWCDNAPKFSTTPLIVHPRSPENMFAMDYHVPLLTTNQGVNWQQVYCNTSGSYWSSRGISLMGTWDICFSSDDRMFIAAADFAGFRSPQGARNSFEWLNWTNDGTRQMYHAEYVSVLGAEQLLVVRDRPGLWIRPAEGETTGHTEDFGFNYDSYSIAIYDPSIVSYTPGGDGFGWRYLSRGLDSILQTDYAIDAIEMVGEDKIFAACSWGSTLDTTESRICRGTITESGCSWELWATVSGNKVSTLQLIPGTTRLLASGATTLGLVAFDTEVASPEIDPANGVRVPWLDASTLSGGTTQESNLASAYPYIRCIAVDSLSQDIYIGTRGSYYYGSTGLVGTVLALRGPYYDRTDSTSGEVVGPDPADWELLANFGTGLFGFESPVFWGNSAIPSPGAELDGTMTDIRDIVIDPHNPRRIYVGMGNSGIRNGPSHILNGAWVNDPTATDGTGWVQVSGGTGDGVSTRPVSTLAIDPMDEGNLFVGTLGHGCLWVPITPAPIPVVSAKAEYAVSPNGDEYSILAVKGTAQDGGPLATVYADASALGGPAHLDLNDSGPAGGVPGDAVAGDNIWSAVLTNPLPAGNEFTVPVVARDGQWNTYTGDLAVKVAVPTGQFSDKSASTGDLGTVTGVQNVAVPLDYDGDTLQDILIGRQGQSGVLMHAWRQAAGVPVCLDVTAPSFPTQAIDPGTLSLVSADIDNDGDEDIFTCHDQTPRVFLYDSATATYTDATSNVFPSPTSYSSAPDRAFAAAWADYDGDGWVDLAIIGSIDGSAPPGYPGGVANLMLYRNVHGRLYYSSVAATTVAGDGYVLNNPPLYVMWSDPNNDARPDLFFSDVAGPLPGAKLFVNQGFFSSLGDNGFADLTATWFGGSGGPANVASARFFDYNNDETQDLVVARSGSQDNLVLYENTGTAFRVVDKSTWATGDFVTGLSDVIVRDLDLDGSEDLIAVSEIGSGRPHVLLNDRSGAGRFVEFSQTGLDIGGVSGGFANTWGSAMPAIYLAKGAGGAAATEFLFGFTKTSVAAGNTFTRYMVATDNAMNSSGLGTKIMIEYTKDGESTPTWLTRWIGGSAGRRSQQAKMVEFGLGAYSGNDVQMTFTWPDGTSVTGSSLVSARVDSTFIQVAQKSNNLPAFVPQKVKKQTVNVTSSFIVGADNENYWEFVWDMTAQTDPALVFQRSTSPAACSCMTQAYPDITLRYGDPGVELDVVAIGEGVYRHTLRWHAPCCEAGCSFNYDLTCSLGTSSVSSGTLTCSTGAFCVSGF